MGIIQQYVRIDQDTLNRYFENSQLLQDDLFSTPHSEKNNLLDIGKSWDGLFYVITGEPLTNHKAVTPPLKWLIYGPNILDLEQDMGYGPATYLTPTQTQELFDAVKVIAEQSLSDRFDANKMNEEGVYPEFWEDPEALNYLIEEFRKLKAFLQVATQENQAVISFLC
ncbi:DUF1877 family protein [Sphingobacterium faecium]|uniref:YfbM family protein n=1 Tax=Sphingobacterium faecium TaxID=34087 RepID=UPI001290E0A9|nr:YfbM family protein [Sphingobacterium faecium]MQP26626.1 DUF1877 family protein [Sphingobacterium faecium]